MKFKDWIASLSAAGPIAFASDTLVLIQGGITKHVTVSSFLTKSPVDQPQTRTDATTTPSLVTSDIGGFIKISNAGAITLTTANLSTSLRTGGAIRVVVMVSGGGTVSIADGAGCTHSGSPSGAKIELWTDDGVTWLVR